jgi:hypothetical protein
MTSPSSIAILSTIEDTGQGSVLIRASRAPAVPAE